jgi:hypothetical protein
VSATRAIQTAMFGILNADTTLAGLSLTVDTESGEYTTVGVYDDVPDKAKFPHVLFGNHIETDWNALGGRTDGIGWKDIIRIHARSRYQGKYESLRIMERVVALLNYQSIAVSGFGTVDVKCEGTKSLKFDLDRIETRDVIGEFCVMVRQ